MRVGLRAVAAAAAGYAIVAYWTFRPTPSGLAHTIPAFSGLAGDALFHTWGTNHVSRTILVDPLHLFEAGIFHPARHTLAYGDHMIGEGLLGLPIWLATGNPLLEFNLLTLASFVLCATTAFRYRRETGGGLAGAVATGLVFSFTPFRLNSPMWPQVLLTFAMPLAVAAWLRWVQGGRGRDLAAWVGWWVVHSLMGMYLAFYFAVVMGVLALAAIAIAPAGGRARIARGTVIAGLGTAALLAPTLWPYVVLRATQSHVRTAGLGTQWTFLLPGPGTLSGTLAGFDGRIGDAIVSFGPGLLTSALVAAGLVVARRRAATSWERFVWVANVLGLAIALAIMFVPIELQLRLPGFDMMRMTNRAFHVGLLFAAWFAGAAVDAVVALGPARVPRVAIATILVALLALDAGAAPTERRRMPVASDLPPIYEAVRGLPDRVLYERTDEIEGAARALYFSIFHGKALVNGYSGFTSPGPTFAVQRLFEFPAEPARALLATLGVHAVLVRDISPAALDRRLAALPSTGTQIVARDGAAALVRVDEPAPSPPPAAVPLARAGRALSASGNREALAALEDDDPRTVWQLAVERGAVPSLTIDLGVARMVAGVRCVGGSLDSVGVYLADVETSVDGTEWTPTGARFDPDSLPALFAHPADVRWWDARFTPRPARWVRLTNARLGNRTGTWELAEVDVLTLAEGSSR
ncbi:MAG TPA: discoidin domain-containing protein [Candidatus Eisenbacteria bacterium]|nr:discoidin domain-containing protein [Candidatus Eisenbacteria bacterium]